MTTAARRAALLADLPEDVDGILVTHLVNVRNLTGFTGSNGAVLVARGERPLLATDGRYETQAAEQSPDVELQVTRTVGPDLARAAAAAGLRRLAIERQHVTLTASDALIEAAAALELVDASQPVERLRIAKDDTEIAALRQIGRAHV